MASAQALPGLSSAVRPQATSPLCESVDEAHAQSRLASTQHSAGLTVRAPQRPARGVCPTAPGSRPTQTVTVPGELGPRGSFRLHMWQMPCMCTSIWASTKFHFTKPATSPWYYFMFVTADLGRGDLSVP